MKGNKAYQQKTKISLKYVSCLDRAEKSEKKSEKRVTEFLHIYF